MINIYDAANSLEAHMIKNLLEQSQIPAHIKGEYLQGGIGELPAAGGLVSIAVDKTNAAEARRIIKEWEQNNPQTEQKDTTETIQNTKNGLPIFSSIIAFIVGAICMHIYLQVPTNYSGIDFNDDGIDDMRWSYHNNTLINLDVDYNLDGKIDEVTKFKRGISTFTEKDADFDGVFDSYFEYHNEAVSQQKVDSDNNGVYDVMIDYQTNTLNYKKSILDEKSGFNIKHQYFVMDKLKKAELDTNGDGKPDVLIRYDSFEEETGRTPLN